MSLSSRAAAALLFAALLPLGPARAQEAAPAAASARATLRDAIEALRPPPPAWSAIPWRSCLLEAVRESQEYNKPILVWALGGNPTGRC